MEYINYLDMEKELFLMPKWKDDKFAHLDSDIEKLRVRTTMYISYTGSRGALHLCKE